MTNDEDFELPEGWILSSLGAAASLVKDKVDPTQMPEVSYVGLEHVEAHTMRILGHGRGADVKSTKTRFSAGDVLYGKLRPYLNKVARPDFRGICSTDFLVFTESSDLYCGFLANYLNQLWVADRAHHLSSGVELPRVDWKSLAQLPIAYPRHKADQRAVVALVEEARQSQANATSHFVAARRVIERFRQAVIIAACSGRLTATWRESNGSAAPMADVLADMMASREPRKLRRGVDVLAKVDEALDKIELPNSWTVATVSALLASGALEDVKDGNHGANHPKSSEFTSSGLPFITANCVKDGVIDYNTAPKVSGAALARLRVGFAEPGDVVLTHKASVGRVAMNTAPCVLTPQTTYYRTTASLLSRDYLALFFESLYFYRQLTRVMSQTTRDFVPISQQYLLSVVLPPPEEQHEIVRRVDQLLTVAAGLKQRIEVASKRVERSSQAVLAKAFRGELSVNGGSG